MSKKFPAPLGWLLMGLLAVSLVYAGTTNYDRLELKPESATGNTLTIQNAAGTAVYTIDNAGAVTATGAQTLSGAHTFTADVTLSGAGIDILANADGQNDLFTEAVSGADAFFTTLDADTSINSDGTLVVDLTSTLTGSVALNGGAVLADTFDLTCGADAGCDIGASATEFGTVWVQILDDGDGTVDVAAALDVSGSVGLNGGAVLANTFDLTVGTEGGSDLGSETVRLGNVFMTQRNIETPPAVVTVVGPTNIVEWAVLVDASSNVAGVDLPDATTVKGQIIRVVWGDTTTNNVEIKSDGGTIGLPDPTDTFIAAATGVTPSANNGFAEWQSDGTNWAFVGGDAVASL